jgi:hypothetical protein
VEVRSPLLDRAERLPELQGDPRAQGRLELGIRLEVREVILMQDHAVVLEPQTAGQFRELVILPGRSAALPQLGQLLVERVHLHDVSRVQLQMLLDLGVGDAVEALQMVEPLLRVDPSLRLNHRVPSSPSMDVRV